MIDFSFLFENGIFAGAAGVAAFLIFIGFLKSVIKVSLPNLIFVVTGRKKVKNGRRFGFSVERGRTMVIPYFQQVGYLDLGVLPINVRVEGVNSANGITMGADATACVCIDDDNEAMLYAAVERLMGKTRDRIKEQIQQTLVGNFRGALNKATPLQAIGMEDLQETPQDGAAKKDEDKPLAIQGERAHFRNELLKDSNSDLSSFGMKVVSVSLQKIWDTANYIGNLAQKMLAQKRKQVEIEEARLRAIAEQTESDSARRISVAKSRADERIIAARQRLEVYRQDSEAEIRKASLEADNTILEAQNRSQRDIQELLVELKTLENQSETILEEEARKRAAQIVAEGEKAAASTVESAKNTILDQKARMLVSYGDVGKAVLFMKQKLPALFEQYRKYAEESLIDSLVIMDDRQGINGAVNRGPHAFADFIDAFEKVTGISMREILGAKSGEVE